MKATVRINNKLGLHARASAKLSKAAGSFRSDVSLTRNYLFTPPWGHTAPAAGQPSALLRRGFLKPWPAGAYLVKARKRVYTLTPIRRRRSAIRSTIARCVEK